MDGRFVRTFRYYKDQRGNIVWLAFLSFCSANFQTLALVIVVPLAQAISLGHRRFKGTVGHVHIDTTTTVLALLACAAIVVAAFFDIFSSWVRSFVMSRWEYAKREQIIEEYLRTDYPTQTGERL